MIGSTGWLASPDDVKSKDSDNTKNEQECRAPRGPIIIRGGVLYVVLLVDERTLCDCRSQRGSFETQKTQGFKSPSKHSLFD